jgi:hypothetical protein
MSRCQHCNKLTHSEDLIVEYAPTDHDKVFELSTLLAWKSKWQYLDENAPPNEFGKLRCGDIWIHFRIKKENHG